MGLVINATYFFKIAHPVTTVVSHVPTKGTIAGVLLASQFRYSISALFFPLINLFGKETQVQRTRGCVLVNILALKLIALHKQYVLLRVEGRLSL